MAPRPDLGGALAAWIAAKDGDKVVYEIVRGPADFMIKETTDEGKAEIRCTLSPGVECAIFIHQLGPFNFLAERKHADGAVLFFREDGSLGAWIVECKKKVSTGNWGKALQQMRGTLARLRAVAGVLGIELSSVVLGTAFREEQLSPEHSPNPALGKLPLGALLGPHQRLQQAWLEAHVTLNGLSEPFRHERIQLDINGELNLSPHALLTLSGVPNHLDPFQDPP